MPKLPTGIAHASLSDLGHYRGHGIDRLRAWCLGPMCFHEGRLTFDELAVHGVNDQTKLWDVGLRLRCTRCGARNADTQPAACGAGLMGAHYPAMSMIFVADLLDAPGKIELEATAVISPT
jgi:hypothetical protein